MTGTCQVAIPAYDRSQTGNRLTLEYSGNLLWNPGTVGKTGTIIICMPFEGLSSNPANSATVALYPEPTCGGGTGYYVTDTIIVTAHPAEGFRVTGFVGGATPGSGVRWSYPSEDITLQPVNGSASMISTRRSATRPTAS